MAKNSTELKINVKFSINEIISAIKELDPEEKEFFIENLLASTSPEYIESIKEAREDYKAGRVSTHEEVFKNSSKQ